MIEKIPSHMNSNARSQSKQREITNFSAITVEQSRNQNIQAVYSSTKVVQNRITY